MKRKQNILLTEQLARLLVEQAKHLIANSNIPKSNVEGFKSVGEILTSDGYYERKLDDWSKN